jgi:hypothetical protein
VIIRGRPTPLRSAPLSLAVPALTLGLVLAMSGCTWTAWVPTEPPPDPDGQRRLGGEVLLGEPKRDRVDCEAGDCRDWYGVRVTEPGTLHVQVEYVRTRGDSSIRLILHGPAQALGQTGWDEPSPLRLQAEVVPGVYWPLVEGSGASMPYEVLVTMGDASGSVARSAESASSRMR